MLDIVNNPFKTVLRKIVIRSESEIESIEVGKQLKLVRSTLLMQLMSYSVYSTTWKIIAGATVERKEVMAESYIYLNFILGSK